MLDSEIVQRIRLLDDRRRILALADSLMEAAREIAASEELTPVLCLVRTGSGNPTSRVEITPITEILGVPDGTRRLNQVLRRIAPQLDAVVIASEAWRVENPTVDEVRNVSPRNHPNRLESVLVSLSMPGFARIASADITRDLHGERIGVGPSQVMSNSLSGNLIDIWPEAD